VDLKQTRRRGSELETAILDAAWDQLIEKGYRDFTFEAVAARAGTSRPVLYRRWADRGELLRQAIRHGNNRTPIEVPDTGTLRNDVITLISRFNAARADYAAVLGVQLAEYFRETGTSLNDLRDLMRTGRGSAMQQILDRAQARGDVDLSKLTPRAIEMPVALAHHELVMTMAPVSYATITEIVDDLWLPMLQARGALL